MKLKTLIKINKWITPAINHGPNSTLQPISEGWNDNSSNWDGIIEGGKNEWFAYVGSNDWHKHLAEATIYINEEGQKPHKIWVGIKTHGLRKNGDTNEVAKQRVRKHTNKIVKKWMSEAKRLYKPELNEVGNPIIKTWLETFRSSLESIKPFILEWGESEIDPPHN